MAEVVTNQKRRENKPAQPKRNKPKGKPVPKGPKSIVPASLYFCECHDEQATKAPCIHEEKDRAENKKSSSALGTWRCSVTKKKCKVRRRNNNEGVEVNVA